MHPRLFHMAEYGCWESLRRHGLLSTTALLDEFGVWGSEREAIESMRRKTSMRISKGDAETAWIRDQKPLHEKQLAACLTDGLLPADWYRTLNGKVFFWLTRERLLTLMGAYRRQPHLVLEVDTAQLLASCWESILLAPMNTGSTSRKTLARGLHTFQRPDEYAFEEHQRRKGGRTKAIVELTVQYAVRDIAALTVSARHCELREGELVVLETVYEREP